MTVIVSRPDSTAPAYLLNSKESMSLSSPAESGSAEGAGI
jgi:hypothetical protein